MNCEQINNFTPKTLAIVSELRGNVDAYQFDRDALAGKPIGSCFWRRAFTCDFPDGQFEEFTQGGKSVVLMVTEPQPGKLAKKAFITLQPDRLDLGTIPNFIGYILQKVDTNDLLITYFWHKNYVDYSILPFCSADPNKSNL